jgi:hypothetical protein
MIFELEFQCIQMYKARASKGFIATPRQDPVPNASERSTWIAKISKGFVAPSKANREIYAQMLEIFWPEGHGIPGPALTQVEIRDLLNERRRANGKPAYLDVFRRLRELQGDEGLTCIIKEGTRYQLQKLEVGTKREPRAKPPKQFWKQLIEGCNHSCSHCGQREPLIRLSPDHRQPRSRGGSNDESNWQPLCEQCNIAKSSACQGCSLNCYTCHWAFPERFKPVNLDDENKEQVRRYAEREQKDQSFIVNEIVREYFLRHPKGK